jgi:hypothetical protein
MIFCIDFGRAKSCCYVQQFPRVTALIKLLNFGAVDNRSYKIINGENKINFLSKAGFVYKDLVSGGIASK